MERFVCASNEKDRDELIELGFEMLYEQKNQNSVIYVFRNIPSRFSKIDKSKYLFTNTMFFNYK